MLVFNRTRNFNLFFLLSKTAVQDYEPVNGKLCDHFGFKVAHNIQVIDGEKIYCFHCEKVFIFCD